MSQQLESRHARPVPGRGDGGGERRYLLEPSARRVRVMLGGELVADSCRVQLLFETGKLPIYYFPQSDVRSDLLTASGREDADGVKGPTVYFRVTGGKRVADDAAWRCAGNPGAGPDLSGLIAFDWKKMDAWYEEDEEVFVHARDPYHRIDVLESSRRVQVSVGGVEVADSRRPMMLFETGLPTRYYLPKLDVRLALLESGDAHSACPYKGTASYFHLRTDGQPVENIAWCYENPIPEALKIAGRICFFDERVDVKVDGVRQVRPITRWS